MNSNIRVRFAPSPTGHLHVGGARTAFYNWLFARQAEGKFILRFEDTDIARSTKEAENVLLSDLKWLGFDWDEGPDRGGEFGPYRQTERVDIYKKYAQGLINEGKAYYCYCTDEELEKKREAALSKRQVPQYDGKCEGLSEAEQEKLKKEGHPAAIRFRALRENIILYDLIREEVEFQAGMVGDFVILRAQGIPTYNFACVVDDALMKISHVLRAEEHLSNTYRQIMLYQALNFSLPKFGHFSLILGKDPDGNISKLSKRHGATSVSEFKEKGYLPQALMNYLSLLGWSSPDGDEIIPGDKLISSFSLARVSKSPSIFDLEKLNWMNGQYLHKMEAKEILNLGGPFIKDLRPQLDKDLLEKMIDSIKNNLTTLAELPQYLAVYSFDKFSLKDEAKKLLKELEGKKVILAFKEILVRFDKVTETNLNEVVKAVKEKSGAKGRELFMPMRIALSGMTTGPELPQLMTILSKEESLKRIARILDEIKTL